MLPAPVSPSTPCSLRPATFSEKGRAAVNPSCVIGSEKVVRTASIVPFGTSPPPGVERSTVSAATMIGGGLVERGLVRNRRRGASVKGSPVPLARSCRSPSPRRRRSRASALSVELCGVRVLGERDPRRCAVEAHVRAERALADRERRGVRRAGDPVSSLDVDRIELAIEPPRPPWRSRRTAEAEHRHVVSE